ncbi:MAG: hypothetical protein ACK6EB_39140, partial [Planctomyces sp.]
MKTPAPGDSYPQNRCNALCLQFFTACVTAGTHHRGDTPLYLYINGGASTEGHQRRGINGGDTPQSS